MLGADGTYQPVFVDVLLTQGDLSGWLWSLLASFDLLTLWTMFLLATGYSVAGKRGLGAGFLGVCIPWAIYVVIKVGFRLVFG